MRRICLLTVVVLVSCPARCPAHGLERLLADLVPVLIQEITDSQIGTIAVELFWWTLLGGVVGFFLGIAAYFVIRALGGYRWQWRHAVWLRALTLILMALLCPVLLGMAGCAEGGLRGGEVALRESQIGTKLLPQVGGVGTDLLAALYVHAPSLKDSKELGPLVPQAELEKFRNGDWRLDPAELERRLDALPPETARRIVEQLQGTVLADLPQWQGGLGQKLLEWVLPALASRAPGERGRAAVEAGSVGPFLAELKQTAAGGDGTLTHAQITTFLTQQVIVPALLRPLRSAVRGQQTTYLLLFALVLLLPVVCFRGAEYVRVRNELPAVRLAPDAAGDDAQSHRQGG